MNTSGKSESQSMMLIDHTCNPVESEPVKIIDLQIERYV